jgi:putative Mg2+ transporter-C (MgtC) family protein
MQWERSVPDLSAGEVVLRVVLAAVLGGAIGAEREIREREAGLRTHLLVSVGAALFTLVSAYAWSDFAFSLESGVTLDPTRISAQIVTGIGFLGAGAIIRQGLSVRGLTTAATLWVVAAIGLASGAGYYWAAVVTTALVLVTLWPLRILAHQLALRIRPGEPRLFVELATGGGAAPVLEALEGLDVRIDAFRVDDDRDGRHVALDVAVPAERREAVVPALARLETVTGVRWSD